METSMITVGMNYEVQEGKAEIFEGHFARVVEAMAATNGHVRTEMYRRCGAERSYLILSEWQGRAEFDAFLGSEAFRRVTAWGKSGILASRPRHEIFGAAPPPAGAGPARAAASAR
jgi:heme-degrading monooxygenase HmoA